MNSQKLINKVILEGEIIKGNFSKNNNSIYFARLKQARKVVNFSWVDYYSIYALAPLSKKLSEIAEKGNATNAIIEGELRTHASKTTQEVYTSILVNKIIDINEQQTNNNNKEESNKENGNQ